MKLTVLAENYFFKIGDRVSFLDRESHIPTDKGYRKLIRKFGTVIRVNKNQYYPGCGVSVIRDTPISISGINWECRATKEVSDSKRNFDLELS